MISQNTIAVPSPPSAIGKVKTSCLLFAFNIPFFILSSTSFEDIQPLKESHATIIFMRTFYHMPQKINTFLIFQFHKFKYP